MSPERWHRVKEAFESALLHPPEDRARFLDGVCADDPIVRQEVTRLLSLEPPSGFLESPPGVLTDPPGVPPPSIEVKRWRDLEIRGELGKGGFGRVFQAWDPKLNREVALKLVPMDRVDLGSGKEAQRLARVRHGNIVTVYGADSDAGYYGLWMELIRGQTLQQILDRQGPYGAREAALIAIDICQALAAVHAAGLLHRDVKAQNVMREEGGRILLMDFGLGKEFVADARQDGAEPLAGTPRYMAPELLAGEPAGVPSDIYAAGVLLYHLLTNSFPVMESAIAVGGVSHEGRHRSLHDVRPDLPWGLVQIAERALCPDPAGRFSSAGQMLTAISAWLQTPDSVAATETPRTRVRWRATVAAATVAAVVLAAVVWRVTVAPPHKAPVFHRITSETGLTRFGTVSTDGKVLAYASDRSGEGNLDIWVQNLPDGSPLRLTATPEDEDQPALSPDGRFVAYRSHGEGGAIYSRPVVSGAAEILLAKGGRDPRFSPDGSRIVFWSGDGGNLTDPTGKIFVVPTTGGSPKQIQPGFADARHPTWSPDGTRILFRGTPSPSRPIEQTWDWWITGLDNSSALYKTGAFAMFRRDQLTLATGTPSWAGDAIVFSARMGHSTDIWRVRVSSRGVPRSSPERITTGSSFAVDPWAAADGSVFYTELSASVNVFGVPLSPAENGGAMLRLTSNVSLERRPTISADGKRLAFARHQGDQHNIFVRDLDTQRETALTAAAEVTPAIDREGSTVGWSSLVNGKTTVFAMPVTGGAPQILCDDCGEFQEWTPIGHGFFYVAGRPKAIYRFDPGAREKRLVVGDPAYDLDSSAISADGNWLAFVATLGDRNMQIFVARISGAQPVPRAAWIPITSGTAQDDKPRWAPDRSAILFMSKRDGFQCIWKQPLARREMLPLGKPAAFLHLHEPTLSMQHSSRPALNLSVARDLVIFNLGDVRANIWVVNTR